MLTRADIERLWAAILAVGARRLAIAGLVVAIGAAAVLAVTHLAGRSELEVAYIGLSPSDGGRISRALVDAGLVHELSADGSRLMTRRSDTARVRALLAERGLPSNPGSGYELFDKVGPLGLTSFMQEITRVRALEGEIARSVQMLKGVRAARVHVVVGEAASFRRQRQSPSASVVIRSEVSGDRSQTDAIRNIVSAAVPGLAAADVRIVNSEGHVLSSAGEHTSPGADRLVSLEKAIGIDIQSNVSRTLAPQLGLDNFEVSVSPRLNIDKRQINETSYSPETRVERSIRVVKETGSAQNGAGRANVSVEQNIPSDAGGPSGGEQTRRANQKRDELINYEVGSRATTVVSEGYRIDRLTVAVVVNAKRIAELVGPGASSEHISKRVADIERLVASAAGLDASRGDVVTVAAVEFVEGNRPAEVLSTAGAFKEWIGQHTALLLQIGTTLAATAILVFFGMRPAIRALTPSNVTKLGIPASEFPGAMQALTHRPLGYGQSPALPSASFDGNPGVEAPTDVIKRLAAEDPSRVAMVLRRWLREETAR